MAIDILKDTNELIVLQHPTLAALELHRHNTLRVDRCECHSFRQAIKITAPAIVSPLEGLLLAVAVELAGAWSGRRQRQPHLRLCALLNGLVPLVRGHVCRHVPADQHACVENGRWPAQTPAIRKQMIESQTWHVIKATAATRRAEQRTLDSTRIPRCPAPSDLARARGYRWPRRAWTSRT